MGALSVEWRGDVAVVRWDDGENRLNLASIGEWHDLLGELEAHDGPLSVVLTGTGKFFSNGLDLDRMSSVPDEAGPTVSRVHRLLGRLLTFPRYVVGALNGHTFAAGAMISACCDVRVMREDRGFWCLPEVDLRLPLTDPMFEVVVARLPWRAAQEAIITGRRYGGAEALAAGIVDEVAADPEAVVDRAVELAAAMAPKSSEVIAVHKAQLFGAASAACGWPET